MTNPPPFHPGEVRVQTMAGEREMAEHIGQMIKPTLAPPLATFIEHQQMLIIGTVDKRGLPWASILFGPPGFVRVAEGGKTLEVTEPYGYPDTQDLYASNLASDPRIGMLAINLETRRRVRVNGKTTRFGRRGFSVSIDEAYPNCPKYIQSRSLTAVKPVMGVNPSAVETSYRLHADHWKLIRNSDTFFVASLHQARGVDVSHRGGTAGFIEQAGPAVLRIPDYPGNSIFNTLGNIQANPVAGITVLDFDTGQLLQIAGTSSLDFTDQPDADDTASGGTGRYWQLEVEAVRARRLPVGANWSFRENSPFLPQQNDR